MAVRWITGLEARSYPELRIFQHFQKSSDIFDDVSRVSYFHLVYLVPTLSFLPGIGFRSSDLKLPPRGNDEYSLLLVFRGPARWKRCSNFNYQSSD